MRFKYYLRGAGVGIVITTLIFTIALAFYEPNLSKADIERKARDIGMEYTAEKDTKEKTDNKDSAKKEKNQKSEGDNETSEGVDIVDSANSIVDFTIAAGDSSTTVSKHLQEAGLVDDAASFDLYLADRDLDNLLMPGTYKIPQGSSFIEIGQLLTAK